jgi:uncharacterized protein YkwD
MRAILLALMLVAAAPAANAACQPPSNGGALERAVIERINEVRRARGLAALRPSGALAEAAQGHACDMARRGYFAHERPGGGPDLRARVKSEGFRMRLAVENIARTRAADPDRTMAIWRDSQAHWANLLHPRVREVGVGLAQGGDRVYWVMNAGTQH